jgi:hypothetical protein
VTPVTFPERTWGWCPSELHSIHEIGAIELHGSLLVLISGTDTFDSDVADAAFPNRPSVLGA